MANPRVPQEMIDAVKYIIIERVRRGIDDCPRSQERIFLAFTRLSKFKQLKEDAINCKILNGNNK